MQSIAESLGAPVMAVPADMPDLAYSPTHVLPLLAQAQSLDTTQLAIRVVVVLGVTAGLLLVITHFLKRMGYGTGAPKAGAGPASPRKRRSQGATPPALQVEQIMPLTRQAKVATINVEGHRLVVGITDQQVSLLKDLNDHGPDQPTDETAIEPAPVAGELERYPIDPAIIRAAQLRSRRADTA